MDKKPTTNQQPTSQQGGRGPTMEKHADHGHHGIDTRLIHAGKNPTYPDGLVSPPLYRASTIIHPTLAHVLGDEPQQFIYGRHGTIPAHYLRQALTELEQGHDTLLASSGLNAITTLFLALATTRQNPVIFITDNVYDPVRQFATNMLMPLGVRVIYFDPLDTAALKQKITEHKDHIALLWLESPGSQTFEVCDLDAIVSLARANNILVGIDNTWAAGILLKPITHGVHYVMHALTKYIAGHADILMGSITSDSAEHHQLVAKGARSLGLSVSADDIYMVLRGLRTLAVRLRQHQINTAWLVDQLAKVKQVRRILYPAHPDSPGHEYWRRDFSGAAGLFAIIIDPLPKSRLADFLDHMKLFKMGFSWGGFESLIIPQYPNRTIAWRESGPVGNGDQPTLLRIQVGLENKEDLWADLQAAFQRGYV